MIAAAISGCHVGLIPIKRLDWATVAAARHRSWAVGRSGFQEAAPYSSRPRRRTGPVFADRQGTWSIRAGAVQWRLGGPAESADHRVTTLDHQLYAWLAEADDLRFERAFSTYFSVAFPAVVRRLARMSRCDLAQLEELAQDALLRFFEKVGRSRREASEAIRTALDRIRPLNLGPFHERKASLWTNGVASFREQVMNFRLGPIDGSANPEWKAAIRSLAERIPLLQRQGCQLLHSVQLALRWTFEGENSVHSTGPAVDASPASASLAGMVELNAATGGTAVPMEVIDRFSREVISKTTQAIVADEQHPGFIPFVDGTYTVVLAVPELRVPTNGYLFQIATTIYLDDCKKRGRQKRGGVGANTSGGVGDATAKETDSQHPVEAMTLDSAVHFETEQGLDDDHPRTANDTSRPAVVALANDPTRKYEDEEFLEKFYAYLRKPVDEAAEAYRRAVATGRGIAERRRLESLTNKLARTVSVLSMMGEGHTQEGTADRLSLSRNQVKYIIELVQEAYARFATTVARPLAPYPRVGGRSHAS